MADKDIVREAKIDTPKRWGDKAVVQVRYGDGEWVRLFDFYDDELRFTPSEFIGKTRIEANTLNF